jgi:Fe-S oxidoreductase
MMNAAQAKAITKQKNYNYLVELECKKIDERIRDMVAHHCDTLYQPVDGCVIEQVMKIIEKAGYKVTRLMDAWNNPSNDLKIEWGE